MMDKPPIVCILCGEPAESGELYPFCEEHSEEINATPIPISPESMAAIEAARNTLEDRLDAIRAGDADEHIGADELLEMTGKYSNGVNNLVHAILRDVIMMIENYPAPSWNEEFGELTERDQEVWRYAMSATTHATQQALALGKFRSLQGLTEILLGTLGLGTPYGSRLVTIDGEDACTDPEEHRDGLNELSVRSLERYCREVLAKQHGDCDCAACDRPDCNARKEDYDPDDEED